MESKDMYSFRDMSMTFFIHKLRASSPYIERQKFMNLPVQLESCLAMEELSGQDNDLYSLLDVQRCYSKLQFALKPSESCYGTSTAKQKNENGDVGQECYSLLLMLWTVCMDGRESV